MAARSDGKPAGTGRSGRGPAFRDRIESRRFWIATAIAGASLLAGLVPLIDWLSGHHAAAVVAVPVPAAVSHPREPSAPKGETDRIMTVPYEGSGTVVPPRPGSEIAGGARTAPKRGATAPAPAETDRLRHAPGGPPSIYQDDSTDLATISNSRIKGSTTIEAHVRPETAVAIGDDATVRTQAGPIDRVRRKAERRSPASAACAPDAKHLACR